MSNTTAIGGAELSELLGLYLCKVDDTEIEDECTGALEADIVLWQLLKPELGEIASLGENVSSCSVVMSVTDCIVRASGIAMNEPPREAIAQIAALVSKLRERLRYDIEEARRGVA